MWPQFRSAGHRHPAPTLRRRCRHRANSLRDPGAGLGQRVRPLGVGFAVAHAKTERAAPRRPMNDEPLILDTDTLSELSRGNRFIKARALAYLNRLGRLTITGVSVFERLRGYRAALREGKPYEAQLQAFLVLAGSSVVLPFDEEAAVVAASIWGDVPRRLRHDLGDILIASVAVSRQLALVTRNRRDFERIIDASGIDLRIVDWSKPSPG